MFNSIRTKLTIWYAGVLTLLIIAFAAITYISVDRSLSNETDNNLLGMTKNFSQAVNSELTGEAENISPNEAISEVIKEFKFQDHEIFVFSTAGKLIAKTSDNEFPAEFPENSFNSVRIDKQDLRVFSKVENIAGLNFKIIVYGDLREQIQIKKQLFYIFMISVPIVLLISILFGYLLAKQSLKPVSQMSRQAGRISAENLHERLLIKNERDELGSLAVVLNELLERLENSFEQQRRFMADASHELRTPLAIIRGESEVALSQEDRPNKDLRESLAVVNEESKRLTKIVEDLFTLSRADAGQLTATFRRVYLDEIITDSLRKIRVLADKKNLSLEILTEETEISGDELLLSRLFLNLFDNAVKYNRDGGKISVKLVNKTVTITDTGFGILPDEQTAIFERFYRSDKSRTRSEQSTTSGAGLGLSIAKWIAELHQAELKLTVSDTTGSEFTISFPR